MIRYDTSHRHVRQGAFEDPPGQDQQHSTSGSIGTAWCSAACWHRRVKNGATLSSLEHDRLSARLSPQARTLKLNSFGGAAPNDRRGKLSYSGTEQVSLRA
eukprot:scaffold46624_cov31-Phaeocystis_antarctica.AAC.1